MMTIDRPGRPRRRRLALLLAIALVVAACGGAATPAPTIPAGAVVVHAKNLQFDTTTLAVRANTQFTLAFVNQDGDLHNLAIRTKPDGGGDLVFRFDPVAAQMLLLTVPPIPAGTYYFVCEVHPAMHGTVVSS